MWAHSLSKWSTFVGPAITPRLYVNACAFLRAWACGKYRNSLIFFFFMLSHSSMWIHLKKSHQLFQYIEPVRFAFNCVNVVQIKAIFRCLRQKKACMRASICEHSIVRYKRARVCVHAWVCMQTDWAGRIQSTGKKGISCRDIKIKYRIKLCLTCTA